MDDKRIYRNTENRILGGVCAGLARRLSINATLVRVVFVVFALGTGALAAFYFVLWAVVPADEVVGVRGYATRSAKNASNSRLLGMGGSAELR